MHLQLSQILINKTEYPRIEVDKARASRYADSMRDGDTFPPIDIAPHKYTEDEERKEYELFDVADGAHRLLAYKEMGIDTIEVNLIETDDVLFYAAMKTGDTKELNAKEAEDTARRLYTRNPSRDLKEIAKAVKRSKRTVQNYLKDLIAEKEQAQEVKLLKMNALGLPYSRIAGRLGITEDSIKKSIGAKLENFQIGTNIFDEYQKGFPVEKIAAKYNLPEPLVWHLLLKDKTDQERFSALKWTMRTWDNWYFQNCDLRFGDDWPGRIPGQLVAYTLKHYTVNNPENQALVFDPMAGGGVTPDICLAFNRKCWSFDGSDRKDTRPEIEPFTWKVPIEMPVNGKQKPDLFFLDPPYFSKKDKEYTEKTEASISNMDRQEYMNFFQEMFAKFAEYSKKGAFIAFLNADWYDFQGVSTMDEDPSLSIRQSQYEALLEQAGWTIYRVIDCPMSSERFSGSMVTAMQDKNEMGTTRRHLTIGRLL